MLNEKEINTTKNMYVGMISYFTTEPFHYKVGAILALSKSISDLHLVCAWIPVKEVSTSWHKHVEVAGCVVLLVRLMKMLMKCFHPKITGYVGHTAAVIIPYAWMPGCPDAWMPLIWMPIQEVNNT